MQDIKINHQPSPVIPKKFSKFILWTFGEYKFWILAFVICTILLGLNSPFNASLLRYIINFLNKEDISNIKYTRILIPIVLLMMNDIFHNISWRLISVIQMKVAPKVKNKIIATLFEYVHNHSFKYFQINLSGSIANKIYVLAENIDKLTQGTTIAIVYGSIQCLVAIITMTYVNPNFSIAMSIWTILFISAYTYFSQTTRKLSDEYAQADSIVAGKIVDSLTNSENVRSFSRGTFEKIYLSKYLNILKRKYVNKKIFTIKIEGFLGLSITLLVGFVTFYLFFLKQSNKVTVGDFAFILTLVLTVTEDVWWMSEQLSSMNDSIGKCNQSLRDLLAEIEIKDRDNAPDLNITEGKIEFKDVKFEFDDAERSFLFNCVINSGEKIGLVGFSGSGKSTFIKLLLRFYDPKSGQILIDGQDISIVSQKSLRKQIGLIPQDSNLFNRTIAENIAYGKEDATREEIEQAAKRAHIDDFIDEMDNGYETVVGERGTKISGGQRQRVSIARAILKNAPLLVLDEATSALDSVTEKKIQKSLDFIMENKTTIVIAHRLSTLENMDRILVFKDGKIIEEGNHSELIKKKGEYNILWKEQMGGYIH